MRRLLFLLSALSALGLITLQQNVGVLGRNVPQAGGSGGGGGGGEPAALLAASDIGSPIGGFIPPDPTGDSIDFGNGLALRYRGGTPYLYSIGHNGNVVEYSIPSDGQLATALGGSPTWTTATATQQFGDIYQNALWTDHDFGDPSGCGGGPTFTGLAQCLRPSDLCWDDIDNRLYWSLMLDYDNTTISSPTSIGYSTLDDTAHTGTGIGIWRLSQPVTSGGVGGRWAGGCKVIPSVFASQLGGKHLMVGPGGYHSISSNGPISMGPAGFAVDTTGFTSPTNRDYFAGTILPLQNHPYSTTSTPLRTLRPTSIPTALNLVSGAGGDGVWAGTNTNWEWGDTSRGMAWVNGPNKRGVLFVSHFSGGDAAMTVLASPAPTHTTFAVDALGSDVRVGYWMLVHTNTTVGAGHYNFDISRISAIDTSGAHPVLTMDVITFGDGSGVDSTGLAIIGSVANCGTGYQGSGGWRSSLWNSVLVYDPKDFVKVSNGTIAPDAVLSTSSAQLIVPGLTFPQPGDGPDLVHSANPLGAVYDGTTHRLYVFYQGGITCNNTCFHTQIVVYPVSD